MLRVELGGGPFPRGEGWLNVDKDPRADLVWDLEHYPWPLQDVDEVYSCHCLEHLSSMNAALAEIARICKLGAAVELRLPHPHSQLAMVEDHKHVFGTLTAINLDRHFPQLFWKGERRLKLLRTELAPTSLLAEARMELPFLTGLDDQTVMKWIPGTCHETRFYYTVIPNEHYHV